MLGFPDNKSLGQIWLTFSTSGFILALFFHSLKCKCFIFIFFLIYDGFCQLKLKSGLCIYDINYYTIFSEIEVTLNVTVCLYSLLKIKIKNKAEFWIFRFV